MANQDPPKVPRELNIKIDQCLLNDLVSSDRSIKIEDKTDSSGDDKKPYLDLSITIRAGAPSAKCSGPIRTNPTPSDSRKASPACSSPKSRAKATTGKRT